MFKVLFSVGILSIPSVFSYIGAVPGALLVIGWGSFNTYAAFLLGSFKLRHANIHVGLKHSSLIADVRVSKTWRLSLAVRGIESWLGLYTS
jgi:hypothetical protein